MLTAQTNYVKSHFIRIRYALTVQRIDVSSEHALSLGGKSPPNCSGTCCGLPSIALGR